MINAIKHRPLMCFCTSAFLGLFICSFMSDLFIFITALAAVIAAITAIFLKMPNKRLIIVCLLSFAVFGMYLFLSRTILFNCISPFEGETVVIKGQAADLINDGERYKSTVIKCKQITIKGEQIKTGIKIRVYFNEEEKFEPGSTLSLTCYVFKNDNFKYDIQNGVYMSALANSYEVLSAPAPYNIYHLFAKLRMGISDQLSFASEDTNAFLKGLLIGERTNIDNRILEDFRVAGLTHVLAVSGMNLSFAVLFFDFFLILCGIGYKPRCIIALCLTPLFVIVTGFAVSCVRAAIMLGIIYSGKLFDKISDTVTALSVAAFVILLFSPLSVRNISFLLSTGATAGIVLLTPPLNEIFFNKAKDIRNPIIRSCILSVKITFISSVAATIACLPVLIFAFEEVSLIAPIANVIFVILIQILFYLSIIGLFAGLFRPIQGLLSVPADFFYNFLINGTSKIASFSFSTVTSAYRHFYLVFLCGLVFIGAMIFLKHKYYNFKPWSLVFAFIFFLSFLYGVNYYKNRNNIVATFANVGQGDCSFVSKGSRAVMIDCGGTGNGAAEIIKQLRLKKIKTIEVLALTHLHDDHVKYIETLSSRYKIEKLIYPAASDMPDYFPAALSTLKEKGTQILALDDDMSIDVLSAARLDVYTKQADFSDNLNESCFVYMLRYGDLDILYTGDIELIGEDKLRTYYSEELDCDILQVAHHGSKTSSSSFILDELTPKLSIISVGKDNSYGHPNDDILDRLAKYSYVYRTDIQSTINIKTDGQKYQTVLRGLFA